MSNSSSHTALVTGASRGIGRAIALRLAENGARVIVHYGKNQEAADSVVTSIRTAGGQAEPIQVDLTAGDSAHRLVEKLASLDVREISSLVINAGIAEPAPLAEQTVESFDRHFAVNVRAPYFLLQQCRPLLSEGSSVVFVSSAASRVAFDGMSVYSATKGAIDVLVRNLAKELGPHGIRVNSVSPGSIDTDMGRVMLSTEEGREIVKSIQALKRIGNPEDVADAACFLASDQSRWVTGVSIDTSGGSCL